MKQDFPIIKDSGGFVSEWKTIVDHPHVTSLSAAIDNHMTEVRALSGGVTIQIGEGVVLNDNSTITPIQMKPSDASILTMANTYYYNYMGFTYDPTHDIFIIAHADSAALLYKNSVASLIGDDWAYGNIFEISPFVIGGGYNIAAGCVYDTDNDVLVNFITEYATQNTINAYIGTVSMSGATVDTVNIEYSTVSTTASSSADTSAFVTEFAHCNIVHQKIVYSSYSGAANNWVMMGTVTATGAPSAHYFTVDDELKITGERGRMDYDSEHDQYILVCATNTYIISISGDSLVLDDTIPNLLTLNIGLLDCSVCVGSEVGKVIYTDTNWHVGTLTQGSMTWDFYQDNPSTNDQISMAYNPIYNNFVQIWQGYDGATKVYEQTISIWQDYDIHAEPFEVLVSNDGTSFTRSQWNGVHERIIQLMELSNYQSNVALVWYKNSGWNLTSNNFHGFNSDDITGDDIVDNGNFSNPSINWGNFGCAPTWDSGNGGRLKCTNEAWASTEGGAFYNGHGSQPPGKYVIEFDLDLGTVSSIHVNPFSSDLYVDGLVGGHHRLEFNIESTWDWIFIGADQTTEGLYFYLDNYSVKPVVAQRIGRTGYMDRNQSGLTINTNYYIDRFGRLSTDTSQQYAGKAVSDTEIIIKG